MNWLVFFTLIFMQTLAWSQTNEILDAELKKRVMTVVKDVEVEKRLMNSSEVKKHLANAKYDPNKSKADNEAAIKKVVSDFAADLKGKDAKQLQKLSESMQLESFGLVKSKSVNDISGYLTKKIQRALTGVDPDAKNVKFEDKKVVDQKVYLELSLNNLSKSALYEISRYCFQDLSRDDYPDPIKAPQSFVEYWSDYASADLEKDQMKLSNLNEQGNVPFFQGSNFKDAGDKQETYEIISKGLGQDENSFEQKTLGGIFGMCASAIKLLCDQYQKDQTKAGAKSCIVKNKISEIKKAITQTQKTLEEFNKDQGIQTSIAYNNAGNNYDYGNSGKEKSLDQIATITTDDVLQNLEEDKLKNLSTKCQAEAAKDRNNLSTECKDFLVVDDSLDTAIHNSELQLRLKKETELAHVKSIGKDEKTLREYLEANNYFDLLEKLDKGNLDIEKEIGAIYEARIKAEKDEIQNRVGKRQMSEDKFKDQATDVAGSIEKTINETREDKARLAQVVLFNNIITSSISLQDDKGNSLGTNSTAWNEEKEKLQNASGININLFDNVSTQPGSKGASKSNSISDNQFIDFILGKPQK